MKKKWSWKNIPDLRGKLIVVTGGNSGLGFHAAQAFAQNGAEVILTSRSHTKGEEAVKKIQKTEITGKIQSMELDLANLSSIANFTTEVQKQYQRLDVLLNNAGIMATPYFKTKDGFEGQMGTNHLGHFALTAGLWPILKKTSGARIVNVSSAAHNAGRMDFDNLLFEGGKDYSPFKAYSRSKLANLLFAYELKRKIHKAGLEIKTLAAHPGGSRTNLMRHITKKPWMILLFPVFIILSPLYYLVMQSASQGALPEIRAACDPDVQNGDYFGPDGLFEIRGYPVKVKSSEASHNQNDAEQLWKISEKLTGVNFEI